MLSALFSMRSATTIPIPILIAIGWAISIPSFKYLSASLPILILDTPEPDIVRNGNHFNLIYFQINTMMTEARRFFQMV